MSRCMGRHRGRMERFPRVSGDEPRVEMLVGIRAQFSPRERG